MTFRDECIMKEELARFLDPISLDIMKNPVIAADGKTYEHYSITTWMEVRRKSGLPLTSPMTNLILPNTNLMPNLALKQEITNFLVSKGSIKLEDIKFSLSSDLYIYLDRITSSLNQLKLKPPQIIILGNESHGKSSLLERIVGLPLFPRNKHICTRCVVRVQLRRTKQANPLADISVVNKQRNTHSSSQNLKKLDIKIEPSERVPIDNIRKVVNETMKLLLREQPDKLIIDDREIVIKIELPFVLNLDLVDLPGLITISPPGCKQDLPNLSREIALEVIGKEKDFSKEKN